MSPRAYPRLTPAEVIEVLVSRGFALCRHRGSHRRYKGIVDGKTRMVTVDDAYQLYDVKLMQFMIRQSGLSTTEFYSSTKAAAKKAGLRVLEEGELARWRKAQAPAK